MNEIDVIVLGFLVCDAACLDNGYSRSGRRIGKLSESFKLGRLGGDKALSLALCDYLVDIDLAVGDDVLILGIKTRDKVISAVDRSKYRSSARIMPRSVR